MVAALSGVLGPGIFSCIFDIAAARVVVLGSIVLLSDFGLQVGVAVLDTRAVVEIGAMESGVGG